jgi:hypothetical protein
MKVWNKNFFYLDGIMLGKALEEILMLDNKVFYS